MLHSTLFGRSVNLRCIWQNKWPNSTQQTTVNKAVKLSYFTFPTPNMKICQTLRITSGLLKPSLQVLVPWTDHNIPFSQTFNYFSDNGNSHTPSPAEINLINTLKQNFPSATDIAVVDISGGCGSMYEVFVESPDFKGLRLVKQHQMVTEALKGEIRDMHGLRISTVVSE